MAYISQTIFKTLNVSYRSFYISPCRRLVEISWELVTASSKFKWINEPETETSEKMLPYLFDRSQESSLLTKCCHHLQEWSSTEMMMRSQKGNLWLLNMMASHSLARSWQFMEMTYKLIAQSRKVRFINSFVWLEKPDCIYYSRQKIIGVIWTRANALCYSTRISWLANVQSVKALPSPQTWTHEIVSFCWCFLKNG